MNRRLFEFITIRYEGNYSRFATEMEYSKQRVYKYIYKNSPMPAELIARLMIVHPEINISWLLNGHGTMFGKPKIKISYE